MGRGTGRLRLAILTTRSDTRAGNQRGQRLGALAVPREQRNGPYSHTTQGPRVLQRTAPHGRNTTMIRQLPIMPHPQSRPCVAAAGATLHHLGPGLALAGAIVVSASALEALEGRFLTHPVLEALVLALLLGALVRNTVQL